MSNSLHRNPKAGLLCARLSALGLPPVADRVKYQLVKVFDFYGTHNLRGLTSTILSTEDATVFIEMITFSKRASSYPFIAYLLKGAGTEELYSVIFTAYHMVDKGMIREEKRGLVLDLPKLFHQSGSAAICLAGELWIVPALHMLKGVVPRCFKVTEEDYAWFRSSSRGGLTPPSRQEKDEKKPRSKKEAKLVPPPQLEFK